MKLAVIDHVGNPGGGSRYLRMLLPHLLKVDPQLQITFFGNAESIEREGVRNEWEPLGIQIRSLFSLWLLNRKIFGIKVMHHLIRIFQQRYSQTLALLPYYLNGAVHRELERKVKGFDLLFFPWPYFIQYPKIQCPMVGVFHDFNFRYAFGGQCFSEQNLTLLHRDIPIWLERCFPIVSTHFMKSELERFYPAFAGKAKVISLGPLNANVPLKKEQAREIIKPFGLPEDYILYPTNISPHKNITPLFPALHLLKQKGYAISLVLVGYGTGHLNGRACPFGLERNVQYRDVFGLGYVSHEQIEALIQCARIVVSSSLYEAGNGPGLDAWGRGIPVAMSDIPPYREHLEMLGVKAKLFNPLSFQEIADRLEELLADPYQAKEDARISQQAISNRSWEQIAKEYLAIFKEAVSSHV